MAHARVDGVNVAYHRYGSGDPLVLIHGITTYSFLWKDMVPGLADRFDVISPDLVSCGESAMPHGQDVSIKAQARYVTGLLAGLGIEKAHLAGHDVGGGVAQIMVGAATESEMKEKKARVEDALHATRAAVEEGVVPGGGVALIRSMDALKSLKGANHDQDMGIAILRRAIEEPLRQIVGNAGDDASVVLNKVREGKGTFGFNAATGEYGDMLEMGILDPTKVTRLALQNATSVSGLLLTTEAMVAELPKEENAGPGMPDMGGMGGMM